MSTTSDRKITRQRRRLARETVAETHDLLQVTDRVWHHVDYTKPLVMELVETMLDAQAPPARVLLIGPDSLLAYSLEKLGYQITLWHFTEGYLTDDLLERVDRTVGLEALNGTGPDLEGMTFEAIVVPLILESLPDNAVGFLTKLRRALVPTGTLLLAVTNARRLDLRLLTLFGRDTTPAFPKFHVSFSFPPLPRLRYYQGDELERLVREAGLLPKRRRYVLSHAAYSDIDPHPPGRFLKLVLQHRLMRWFPTTRPTILMELTRRVGDEQESEPADSDSKRISVILSARRSRQDLERTLGALLGQDFPADDYEVLVMHDGKVPERADWIEHISSGSPVRVRQFLHDPAEGPKARNAATQSVTGEICAHTDDGCRIPLGWLPTIAAAFDDNAGVVSGPVVDEPGSHPLFLTFPGSRPSWDHRGLYPISNVAYRRSPFVEAGGFRPAPENGRAAPLLWDTELAWRMERLGWHARYIRHLFMYRSYPPPRRFTWFAPQWKLARDLPLGVKRTPGLERELLTARGFASHTTLYFDLLVVGVVAAVVGGSWVPLLLGFPYLAYYTRYVDLWPISRWRYSLRMAIGIGVRHLIWLSGLLWGSLRARRIVL